MNALTERADAPEATAEPGYTRSNGVWTPLSTMAAPHLKSALAKLQREFPDHREIGPMVAEAERRDAEYAAQQE